MSRRSRFGNIEKLPSGRYRARYFKDGEWHNAPRTFRDHQIAQDWLDDESTDRRRGEWVKPSGLQSPFRKIAEEWMETVVGLRASTRDRDFGYLERYANAEFGDVPIGDIDHALLSSWVAGLSARLAPATAAKALQIVSKVLTDAVSRGLLRSNPAASVKPPKIERQEMRFLNPAEIDRLTQAMDERYRGVVMVGCWGGLRVSELFGLRASDFDGLRVRVTRNLVESEGHLYIEACKTRSSVRTIHLPEVVKPYLSLSDEDFAFTAPEGGPIRLKNWRDRFFKRAVDKAGLEPFRPHDMRHTCAALLIASGAQPLEVSKWLGHTSVAFTLDRYGHLYDDWGGAVATRLDQLAFPHSSGYSSIVGM